MKSINFAFFVLSTLAFLFFVKIVNFSIPKQHYFTFANLLLEDRQNTDHWAVIVKLLLPFIFAFVLSAFMFWLDKNIPDGFMLKLRISFLLTDQLSYTISSAAALVALLLSWPYFLLWDILIDPEYNDKKVLLYASYLSYIVAYFFLAKAGCLLASLNRKAIKDPWPRRLGDVHSHPLYRPLEAVLTGIVSGVIATWLA